MKGQFITDRGQIRRHNEDAGGIFYNTAGQILAIIADGMGGHQAGDVASQMATKGIQEKWCESKAFDLPEETEKWLSDTLNEINESIYKESLENEACRGMGTTVVIAICTEEYITVAHIGDSRCYLLNDHGFNQITEDHSLVNALVRSGQITKNDAQLHPRKNVVLKALGTEENVTADVQSLSWEKGNKLLLCSDGLTDKVLDDELYPIIQSENDLLKLGQKLVDLANIRGGEDNVSLVLLQHEPSEKEGEGSC